MVHMAEHTHINVPADANFLITLKVFCEMESMLVQTVEMFLAYERFECK